MSKHSITAPLTMTIYQMQNKRQGRTWIHLPQRSTMDEKWEAELPLSWRKIKNNICSFREKIRTKQWRFGVSSPHGSEWEVGGTSTWPKDRLPDSILIHQHPLLSVWLCSHLITYLSAYLYSCSSSLFVQVCTCPVSLHPGGGKRGAKRSSRGGGGVQGVWQKGSRGTHRSACLWSLHYRIWHSARAHLISLQHTHTPT